MDSACNQSRYGRRARDVRGDEGRQIIIDFWHATRAIIAVLHCLIICLNLVPLAIANAGEIKPDVALSPDFRQILPLNTATSSAENDNRDNRFTTVPLQLAQVRDTRDDPREQGTQDLKLANAARSSSTGGIAQSHECRPELAGHGKAARRGTCRDLVGDDALGPTLIVVPPRPGQEAFAISKYEISIADYNTYCRLSNECDEIEDNPLLPVTNADYEHAQEFADWLTRVTRRQYSLPLKSEWEYAAIADGQLEKSDINCEMILNGNPVKGEGLVEVKAGDENSWGLTGSIGNAREWVVADADTSNPLLAVGGCFEDPFSKCDVTLALPHSGEADDVTGFRLVRRLTAMNNE